MQINGKKYGPNQATLNARKETYEMVQQLKAIEGKGFAANHKSVDNSLAYETLKLPKTECMKNKGKNGNCDPARIRT
jgi:hypothetical protein